MLYRRVVLHNFAVFEPYCLSPAIRTLLCAGCLSRGKSMRLSWPSLPPIAETRRTRFVKNSKFHLDPELPFCNCALDCIPDPSLLVFFAATSVNVKCSCKSCSCRIITTNIPYRSLIHCSALPSIRGHCTYPGARSCRQTCHSLFPSLALKTICNLHHVFI